MLKLPKPYLSYSQLRVWLEDKEAYRARYYRHEQERGSKWLTFGSEFAKGLEDGTVSMPNLPQYAVKEFQVKEEVEGVPFFAYVDTFDPARLKFREYKTGAERVSRPRWTQRDVDNHMQLDVYSLLIQLKCGGVDDECHLDWVHTRPKPAFVEFDGHRLEAESNEMELTGEVTSFRRVISQTERDRMRILIRSVADEIARDYSAYLSFNPEMSPAAM